MPVNAISAAERVAQNRLSQSQQMVQLNRLNNHFISRQKDANNAIERKFLCDLESSGDLSIWQTWHVLLTNLLKDKVNLF